MKVIDQLIHHFREQGVLTEDQIARLKAERFLDLCDDPWFGWIDSKEIDRERSHPFEIIADESDQEMVQNHRKGRGRKKRRVLEVDELVVRLAGKAALWQSSLRGLVELACHLTPVSCWQDAALAIRQATPAALSDALLAGLRDQTPSMHALWTALDLELFRGPLLQPAASGPTASAYRAVVTGTSHQSLGKHAWILKQPPIREVFNGLHAQRGVLRAVGRLFEEHSSWVAIVLTRSHHDVAYWSLLLLYNARRAALQRLAETDPAYRGCVSEQVGGKLSLRAALLEPNILSQAWTHAMIMEPESILRYLVERAGLQEVTKCSAADCFLMAGTQLVCPVGWPGKHFIYP